MRKVDDSCVETCKRLEQYTLPPKIPIYVHVLLLGATILYFRSFLIAILLTMVALTTLLRIIIRKTKIKIRPLSNQKIRIF